MKLKNRSNLYLVVREFDDDEVLHGTEARVEVPIAGFLTMESADEYAGSCHQDFVDREIFDFKFKVVPLIYYDM